MSVPRGLLGAGLLFWGWQTGNLLVGIALAAIVEAPRWTAVRFELRPADLARIADLCTVIFVALVAVIAATRGVRDGVLAAIGWMPAVLAPIVLAQLVSSSGRIPLSALFQYVRRRKRRDPSTEDPPLDLAGIYLALCVVVAGIGNVRGPGYYIGTVLLAAWALHAVRPRHAPVAVWLGALAVAGAAGYVGQAGLAQLQASLEDWFTEWNLRGMDADPYRSTTDIGSIGRLKQHDAIVLRVYAEPRTAARLKLLHRASFTTYSGTTWHAPRAPMVPVRVQDDGTTWILAEAAPDLRVRMVTRLEGGKALLALPAGAVRIAELPAAGLARNVLGAVQADVGGDWAGYVAESTQGMVEPAAPVEADTVLPAAERALVAEIATELGLHGLPPAEALAKVQRHFAAFSYSTFRESAPPPGTTALADFLRRSKSGHCEYFAAATTLLLRAAGIPARYATGFAMLEYSEFEGAYVVRARHAHAWTRAWVDGRWVDVDTTPPIWFAEEERLAPAWQRLADFVRWATYRWGQRGELGGGAFWYGVLALLVAALAWRFARAKRAVPGAHRARPDTSRSHPGLDSEFYGVERALTSRGIARAPLETLSAWASRATAAMDETIRGQFQCALDLHLRYRFDPGGLDARERRTLRETAHVIAEALHASGLAPGGKGEVSR